MSKKQSIRRVKDVEFVRHELTDGEINDMSKQMASSLARLRELENAKKASAEQFKADIAREQAAVEQRSVLINNGYQLRPTDVERIYDYDSGEFRLVRLDTGETIEQRPLRDNEKQMEFVEGAA